MKLHFEDNLDYQVSAVESIVNLFKGQEINRSEFTLTLNYGETLLTSQGLHENELGFGNKLELTNEELLANLNDIQLQNGLSLSQSLTDRNFTVEMETGTGKTYVYLRTIFELNKKFGFTKYVIIVPSIAIKEGTFYFLRETREHFGKLYPESKGYEFFQYVSNKLGKVRNFATSTNVQIMIATVGSINKKDINNLYRENENTGGEKPIDLISSTNPVIIVDEPQSVDGGINGKGRKAIEEMTPLCTLRYSATHIDKHHMVFRLDAVDAYARELVKQIEIASIEILGGHNKPYVKLISTHNEKGPIRAKIEIDSLRGSKIRREIVTVEDGDDLEKESGRGIYENFRIGTIMVGNNNQSIELITPGDEILLQPGSEYGGVNPDEIKRQMIRRTIIAHLDKESEFFRKNLNVKVLSLFFVDKVENYKKFDENGNMINGKYARFFEQEYLKLIKNPSYKTLFSEENPDDMVKDLHNGYFSIDKKGSWTDTEENNQKNRENAERAYSLIMKEKGELLSFRTKLKFIFSHSALKEGWDNPNVFQICTLRDIGSERERRQTIGRGLRLCVNQDGQRLQGFEFNTLTVIATESYEKFAESLQKEVEEDIGIRFGVVEKHQFANLPDISSEGNEIPFGAENSELVWNFLKDQNYLDSNGKILESLRTVLSENKLVLPDDFDRQASGIKGILRKIAGRFEIRNAEERVKIQARKEVLESKNFKKLWTRIKQKTIYRVNFNSDELINCCIKEINGIPPISKPSARFRIAELTIGPEGVKSNETEVTRFKSIDEPGIELPDIISELEEKTQLTREGIVKILTSCNRLSDFKKNPQKFIEYSAEAINRRKQLILVNGIKYKKVENDFYAQELFEQEELTGFLRNTIKSSKSVYDHVLYDSISVEKSFAEELEKNNSIKIYTKLPSWFTIQTPLGTYNPDWAILVQDEEEENLYFVVETKMSDWWGDLRHKEGAKIECGKKHFEALSDFKNPVKFITAEKVDDVLTKRD